MNHYINYYYNIYPDSIHEENKEIYFNYNDEIYYFVIFNRAIEEANYIYELNVEMIKRGSLVHEIILNKDKSVVTYIDDIPYVLMRVYVNVNKKSDLAEITFINMTNLDIKPNKLLDRSNWPMLWAAKVDYFEYQISQIGKKYPIICEYLSYYIGLAENAISYVKNRGPNDNSNIQNLTIAHRRIKATDTIFDLYNPLTLIIDYKCRDLAEYIKSAFFNGKDVWQLIENYFYLYDINLFDLQLLYARLLFPTYFFDVYEEIVEDRLKEESIMSIIDKASEYEEFLIEFHAFINKNNLMPQLDWLTKKNNI
jgi:spore coat protein YutH